MNVEEIIWKHWNYYLMLEERFIETIQYVALRRKSNFKTFSDKYAILLVNIGTDLDVVFKEICNLSPKERKNADIRTYAGYIIDNRQYIIGCKVILPGYDIILQPFEKWDKNKPAKSLSWWVAFNNMKHNHYNKISHATQGNVLNMLGALYIVKNVYLREIGANIKGLLPMYKTPTRLFDPRLSL